MCEKKLFLVRFVSRFWSLTSRKILKHVQKIEMYI